MITNLGAFGLYTLLGLLIFPKYYSNDGRKRCFCITCDKVTVEELDQNSINEILTQQEI